nr:putative ORF1 [Marmot picobirnavirus]
MTRNQIEIEKYLETLRTNKANEALIKARDAETARANAAREAEVARANLANETLTKARDLEVARANKAREVETQRSNLEREAANRISIDESARSNRAREAQAIADLRERQRANLASELEISRSNRAKEAETSRHNRASEQLSSAVVKESARKTDLTYSLGSDQLEETTRHNKVSEITGTLGSIGSAIIRSLPGLLNDSQRSNRPIVNVTTPVSVNSPSGRMGTYTNPVVNPPTTKSTPIGGNKYEQKRETTVEVGPFKWSAKSQRSSQKGSGSNFRGGGFASRPPR